jgi:YHS domain-containing protein
LGNISRPFDAQEIPLNGSSIPCGVGPDPWFTERIMKRFLASLVLMLTPVVMAEVSTCPVSGEKLGEMGAPVSIDYQGKKVSFCCDSCIAKFQKDPAKYLAKLPPKP